MISYILAATTGVGILLVDQFTKYFISSNFEMAKSYEFLPGFIDITYINNDGGAWGMLGGYTWLLLSVTIVVMLVCISLLLKCGAKDKLMFWSIVFVLSGGIGNMIDRVINGYVVDFLSLSLFQLPNISTSPLVAISDATIRYLDNWSNAATITAIIIAMTIINPPKKAKRCK